MRLALYSVLAVALLGPAPNMAQSYRWQPYQPSTQLPTPGRRRKRTSKRAKR